MTPPCHSCAGGNLSPGLCRGDEGTRHDIMRRREKEISDQQALEEILSREPILHLGLISDGEPYIVPVNYGYKDGTLYVHSAPEGRKIEALKSNPRVCFQVATDIEIVHTDSAHKCSTKYKSVIGWGTASIIEDDDGKRHSLDVLMAQHGTTGLEYPQELLNKMVIIKIEIETMTGKESLD